MGTLMLFHMVNFRQDTASILSGKEVETYASIMPGEYHFFPDEEVDAVSLADGSNDEVSE